VAEITQSVKRGQKAYRTNCNPSALPVPLLGGARGGFSWNALGVGSAFSLLALVGCNSNQPLSPGEISQTIEESVVLIFYNSQGGNGSGFFVSGEPGVCTVLTARHATLTEESLKIQTKDQEIWDADSIRRFPNHDLAVVEFTPKGKNCPYPSLFLGDSDRVNKGDQVYVYGYFNSDGRLVEHFVPGNVTAIDQLPEGYGIAYDATTAGGMSGGPVANETGEIIAIHGRSDIEIYELVKLKGGAFIEVLQATAEEESDAVGSKNSVFKWGIPTKIYQANLAQVPKVAATESLTAEDYLNQGKDLLAQGLYQEAIVAYDKAIDIKPDKYEAWVFRGGTLHLLGKYQDAIASYDKAIEIEPDYAEVWALRGIALSELGKYQDAIASYDKAIKIKPNYASAWHNRGLVLDRLGKYQEALTSYDKAIKIEPDYADAWVLRGIALYRLGKYQDAIDSSDKAIKIKPNGAWAWVARGTAQEDLKRYDEALESYEKAIQFDSNNQKAINNRKRVLEKLGQ